MEFGPVCMSSRRKPFDVRAVESLLILLFKTGEIGRLAYRCPQPGKTSREKLQANERTFRNIDTPLRRNALL